MFSNRNKTNLENNKYMNNQKWLGAFQYYSWWFFLLWNNEDERLGGFNSLSMDPILRAKEMKWMKRLLFWQNDPVSDHNCDWFPFS